MPLNRSSISICLLVLLAGVSSLLVGFSSLYLYLSPNLPSVESLRDVKFQTPLRIYSADNKLIGEYGERRTPINLEEVPPLLIKAFIAAEDDSFYSHNGFDIMSFMRATSYYVLGMEGGGGGSTLTMQMAKMSFMEDDEALLLDSSRENNAFLTYDRSILYKVVQILLAWKIEQQLTKDEILEIYLNQIFLGHQSYGIQAASQVYYGKDVKDLSLAQAAVFAGIQPGPSIYNPISYPERTMRRRGYVLQRMLELGYIDEVQFQQANAEPIAAQIHRAGLDVNAPYVREMARIYMEDTYGRKPSRTDGYRVYTTVDSRLQEAAQQAVINGLIAYDSRSGYRGPEDQLEPVFYSAPANSSAPNEDDENEIEEDPPRLYPRTIDIDKEANNLVPSIVINDDESRQTQQQLLLNPWLAELESRPTYGGFEAAAVVKADTTVSATENEAGEIIETPEHVIEAVLASGEVISIPWQNGPSTAKPSRYGQNPKDTSFLNVGDVIRVQNRDDAWHLVQIPEVQAAFVAMDYDTGAVKALVGGFDYNYSIFNRVMQAERQPGSNIKPFLYTYALEHGYSPATIVNDAPYPKEYDETLEGDWRPSNAGDVYLGLIPLREGFYQSQNMVAVRVLDNFNSRRDFLNSLERFGFDSSNSREYGLSIALGAQVLKPIDVVTGYAMLANGGYRVQHYYIDRVELEGNGVIYEADFPVVCRECEKAVLDEQLAQEDIDIDPVRAPELTGVDETSPFDDFLNDADLVESQLEEDEDPKNIAPRVIGERVAFLLHDMMQDVIDKGTGRRARRVFTRRDLAGKTGTTNDATNAWFSGYANGIVATSWIGFDNNKPLGGNEQGAVSALPMWIEFMQTALQGVPETTREQPPGIVSVRINPNTGKRTNSPDGVFEYFLEENLPEYEDNSDSIEPIFDQDQTDTPQEIF